VLGRTVVCGDRGGRLPQAVRAAAFRQASLAAPVSELVAEALGGVRRASLAQQVDERSDQGLAAVEHLAKGGQDGQRADLRAVPPPPYIAL
jgi:hypothetical protein